MTIHRILKLGTRKSLLAWAQSSWVAREVERLNPGVQVELVGIETQGDRIQDIPLSKVEGKEFFVAEIDQALTSGRVDLTVHSLKDLSLERPEGLICGAIPRRENPRDVVIFGPRALDRLRSGETLKIGTSSPRRLENIPAFLKKALPRQSHLSNPEPSFQFVEIRGNVNTRLSRIHLPVESNPGLKSGVHEGRVGALNPDPLSGGVPPLPEGRGLPRLDESRYLDGVVLAFAGLIRLWADEKARIELASLLSGVRWMVLPLRECPAAPAQGALAVECRKSDRMVVEALKKLHHEETAEDIRLERAQLKKWGGGCHQRFGATAFHFSSGLGSESSHLLGDLLGRMMFVRGKSTADTSLDEFHWNIPNQMKGLGTDSQGLRPSIVTRAGVAWDGSEWRKKSEQKPKEILPDSLPFDLNQRTVFVAHARAVGSACAEKLKNSRVWTSGVSSWFKLAEKGLWVEGCAEGFGFEFLETTLRESVLGVPPKESYLILTHQEALKEWQDQGIRAIGTYQVDAVYGEDAKKALRAATHVFWSSGSQFNELKECVLPQTHEGQSSQEIKHHACGPGKTLARLRQAGIQPTVFPNGEEWRKWLKQ